MNDNENDNMIDSVHKDEYATNDIVEDLEPMTESSSNYVAPANLTPNDDHTKSKKQSVRRFTLLHFAVLVMAILLAILSGAMAYVIFYMRSNEFRSDKNLKNPVKETVSSYTTPVGDNSGKHFSIEEAAKANDQGDKKALKTYEIASLVQPATVSVIAEFEGGSSFYSASGSGFIITADGYVVTNSHVIDGFDLIKVQVPGYDEPFVADIIGSDAQTDIAVLKIKSQDEFEYVTLGDSDALLPGELAVAIGNPFGELEGTVTVGVISAMNRNLAEIGLEYELLQTDASINNGNSGGPLVNSFGEVIGVTNAKISSGEGLGFAIPINDVKTIIEDLINVGYVSGRPVMGVAVVTVDDFSAENYGWPKGVYVREITPDGPAEKCGIIVGDIIIRMGGDTIQSTDDLISVRNELVVGSEVEIVVYRDGEEIALVMTLEEGKI